MVQAMTRFFWCSWVVNLWDKRMGLCQGWKGAPALDTQGPIAGSPSPQPSLGSHNTICSLSMSGVMSDKYWTSLSSQTTLIMEQENHMLSGIEPPHGWRDLSVTPKLRDPSLISAWRWPWPWWGKGTCLSSPTRVLEGSDRAQSYCLGFFFTCVDLPVESEPCRENIPIHKEKIGLHSNTIRLEMNVFLVPQFTDNKWLFFSSSKKVSKNYVPVLKVGLIFLTVSWSHALSR